MLKQQLQAQVVAIQNRSMRAESDAEKSASPNLHILKELIQKRIMEVKLPQYLVLTIRLHDSLLFKEIQECEIKKFSTSTFDSYTEASDLI